MLKLSIAIPTKDRLDDMITCLDTIITQSELPDAVIIVDASKKAGLEEVCLDKLKNIPLSYVRFAPGITKQRNEAIRQNTHDLLLFLDDDTLLDKDYIKNIKQVFTDSRVGGATGLVQNETAFTFFANIFRKIFCLAANGKAELKISGQNNNFVCLDKKSVQDVDWLSGCNMCYRQSIIKKLWCDENFEVGGGEDVDLSCRVKRVARLVFCPSARIIHLESAAARPHYEVRKYRKVMYHFYRFKKNIPQTFLSQLAFNLSLLGFCLQTFFLEKKIFGFIGVIKAIWTIKFKLKDYRAIKRVMR